MFENVSKAQWALVLVVTVYGAMNGGGSVAAMFGGAVAGGGISLALVLGYNGRQQPEQA